MESELFGCERGAYTGAFQKRAGIFELADGGTLMLDEIGDMDMRLQAKLLQALQDHEYRRLGGKEMVRVDIRVIAATHRNLEMAIADGSFRDALGITQKVITASPDTKANADEVAAIVGAPRGALLMDVLTGIHERSSEKALRALREAGEASLDMKLFARLLLERMRGVILSRNAPGDAEAYLSLYSDADKLILQTIAKDSKSAINSRTLLKFLGLFDMIGRSHITQLPLEIAVIDSLEIS